MHGAIEALAIGFSIFLVFGTIGTFILIMRYIAYKEKEALNNLSEQKEFSHE